MRLAPYFPFSDPEHAEARRRALSFAITIGIHLLILLMLLKLAPPFVKMANNGRQMLTFNVAADEQEQTTQAKTATKTHQTHATTAPPVPSVPPPKIELPNKAAPWVLTPGLEKFDVRQVPPSTKPSQSQSDASATDEANEGSDTARPVTYGPAGQALYPTQWYREPTEAELAFYLKKARPGPGFAEIGCEMVARYHVTNCFPIRESPGSGLARAMVDASWQFQVIPARIGNRSEIGMGVIIRFDFSEKKEH